jgi:hypothetical protein
MLGMLRFRLGCTQLTEQSTRTLLISPVSLSMPFPVVYGRGEQHESQCGLAPIS